MYSSIHEAPRGLMHIHSYNSMYFCKGAPRKHKLHSVQLWKESHCCYLFICSFLFICFFFFVLCVSVCQTCCVIYGLKELHVSSANVCEGHVWDFWAIMFNSLTGWHASKTQESFVRLCHFFCVCVTLFFPNYRSGSQVLKHCSAAHLTFLFAPQTPYNAERVVGWFYKSGTCF